MWGLGSPPRASREGMQVFLMEVSRRPVLTLLLGYSLRALHALLVRTFPGTWSLGQIPEFVFPSSCYW